MEKYGYFKGGDCSKEMNNITKDMSINQIIRDYPKAMPILNRHNIDMCCGGVHTLDEVCKIKKLNLTTLLKELNQAA